jgi:hypothetical protein
MDTALPEDERHLTLDIRACFIDVANIAVRHTMVSYILQLCSAAEENLDELRPHSRIT